MAESKTGYFSGSHGATPGINRGKVYNRGGSTAGGSQSKRGRGIKTVGWGRRLGLVFNDLLPYSIRPIKSRHTVRGGVWHGARAELFYYRMRWHSHGKYFMRSKLNKLQFWKKR